MKYYNLVCLHYCTTPVWSIISSWQTSIEHIKNHHRARMEKIQEMIHERVAMLESHESGNRRLNDEEHARATRQVVNFQRKLDSMKASNTDVSWTYITLWIPTKRLPLCLASEIGF